MRGSYHFLSGIIVFVVLWLTIEEITFTMIFIPIALSLFPDVDIKLNSHRNFFLHSTLIWIIVFLYNPSMIMALGCLSIGIHLLLDITITPSKLRGTYTLKFVKSRPFFWFLKKKRGLATTLWLFINFLLSVILLIIEIIIIS